MPTPSPLVIDTPVPPPPWAVMERELIRTQTMACEAFYDKYFDERGYLMCVTRWGALDGPDDAIENLASWPVLYLLGGDDILLDMCKHAQDGHIRQYTEAKTVEVPFARDGMYYKEFPVHSDWAHHAEGLVVFNLLALCDPDDHRYLQRVTRFAGFYMNEDPHAPNYDPEHKIIRSMFNGSRGPILRKTTPLDWAGDPFEDGRFILLHGQRDYQEMLARFVPYVDVAGDHPLNLTSTGLAFNAYALTGEQMRHDPTTPDTRLSDNPNPFNPARVETLVNLMTGGPRPEYARPLHCRVWYFDPERRRPGLPEDVAALVDHIGGQETGLHLVNVNQLEERTVIIQGGAYGEHQFHSVTIDGVNHTVEGATFTVRLAPGAGARLAITMQRHANQPTARFPWNR